MESGLHARQGTAVTNFAHTSPQDRSELAQQLVKDPYTFDFLTLGSEILERELEYGLVERIRSLLLELGKGLHSSAASIYHLRLRCFVVIDLKIEDFKPEFAGKMNFYLSAVDDTLRHADDQSSIGIILCKDRNKAIVEYALRDTRKPMGVARYEIVASMPDNLKQDLPTKDDIARRLPKMSFVMMMRK